jgi:hypothetical protein
MKRSDVENDNHRNAEHDCQRVTPWYKRVWVVATTVGSVAFTIGLYGPTILQNIRVMPTEIRATSDLYFSWLKEDAEWTGQWSSFPEGIVDIADMDLSEGIDLKLNIASQNGEIGGEIATGAICKNVPLDFLLISGKVSGKTARITVWDFVGGRKTHFADIELIRDNHVITVKPVSGQTEWFPSGARIGRHPDVEEQFMFNFCNRHTKISHNPKKRFAIDQLKYQGLP